MAAVCIRSFLNWWRRGSSFSWSWPTPYRRWRAKHSDVQICVSCNKELEELSWSCPTPYSDGEQNTQMCKYVYPGKIGWTMFSLSCQGRDMNIFRVKNSTNYYRKFFHETSPCTVTHLTNLWPPWCSGQSLTDSRYNIHDSPNQSMASLCSVQSLTDSRYNIHDSPNQSMASLMFWTVPNTTSALSMSVSLFTNWLSIGNCNRIITKSLKHCF